MGEWRTAARRLGRRTAHRTAGFGLGRRRRQAREPAPRRGARSRHRRGARRDRRRRDPHPPRTMRPTRRARQGGMVTLLLITLLLLGGMLFAYSALDTTTVRVDRERATQEALAKAKDALIAFAVSHVDGVPVAGAPARPGQLPCPDVTDDGIA